MRRRSASFPTLASDCFRDTIWRTYGLLSALLCQRQHEWAMLLVTLGTSLKGARQPRMLSSLPLSSLSLTYGSTGSRRPYSSNTKQDQRLGNTWTLLEDASWRDRSSGHSDQLSKRCSTGRPTSQQGIVGVTLPNTGSSARCCQPAPPLAVVVVVRILCSSPATVHFSSATTSDLSAFGCQQHRL